MGKHSKKKHKKHHKQKKKQKSSSSDSSSGGEWLEKSPEQTRRSETPEKRPETPEKPSEKRDEWMSLPTLFASTTQTAKHAEKDLQKAIDREAAKYDPRSNVRELNPYWKDGGDGLPSALKFKKPEFDDERTGKRGYEKYRRGSGGWKKKPATEEEDKRHDSRSWRKSSEDDEKKRHDSRSWRKKSDDEDTRNSRRKPSDDEESKSHDSRRWRKSSEDEERRSSRRNPAEEEPEAKEASPPPPTENINEIAAKIIKAEILGNTDLVLKLKARLERARSAPKAPDTGQDVLLLQTSSSGLSKPLTVARGAPDQAKRRAKRTETHDAGKRSKYYPDDDKYSLQQMFENEKFQDGAAQQAEFVKMMGKVGKNDDMGDVFMDAISQKRAPGDGEVQRAIREHRSVDDCSHCLDSGRMAKHLVVAAGRTIWLSLPASEPLVEGHCLLGPVRHAACATRLDEDEWAELQEFRNALVDMFAARQQGVVFFEADARPRGHAHMVLQCVPLPQELADQAPIYFRKAIDECEEEWAMNKKLVNLKGRDVRKGVPQGLPYFWVAFGREQGFAHVVEDRRLFPGNFAQQVLAGMLDIGHTRWRKPALERFDAQKTRVVGFNREWASFDCTTDKK